MKPNNSPVNILHKDLSYLIVGILFDVHTKLGRNYQEKYYQRAVEQKFKEASVRYQKELVVPLDIDGHSIGKVQLDFLVEDKIVLELKAKPGFHPNDFKQVQAYLRSKKLELGILANFRGRKLVYKRILNGALKCDYSD